MFAAGDTVNTGTGDDFTVAKFDRDGTLLWQQTLNGTANGGEVRGVGGGGQSRQRARRRPHLKIPAGV